MSGMNFPVKHIPIDMPENAITERIIKCAITVHRELGPGLLEKVYEEAMDVECKVEGLHVLRQFKVPVLYRGKPIGEYKPDMLINDMVIVEIKSVERFDPVFEAQVLTHFESNSEACRFAHQFQLSSGEGWNKTFYSLAKQPSCWREKIRKLRVSVTQRQIN